MQLDRDLVEQVTAQMQLVEVRIDNALERELNRMAYGAMEYAIDTWPSAARHGIATHPWSKDVSFRAFSLQAPSEGVRVIENTAPPSGYINRGYTRKGPKTARSWKTRGMSDKESYLLEAYHRYIADHPPMLDMKGSDRG